MLEEVGQHNKTRSHELKTAVSRIAGLKSNDNKIIHNEMDWERGLNDDGSLYSYPFLTCYF